MHQKQLGYPTVPVVIIYNPLFYYSNLFAPQILVFNSHFILDNYSDKLMII